MSQVNPRSWPPGHFLWLKTCRATCLACLDVRKEMYVFIQQTLMEPLRKCQEGKRKHFSPHSVHRCLRLSAYVHNFIVLCSVFLSHTLSLMVACLSAFVSDIRGRFNNDGIASLAKAVKALCRSWNLWKLFALWASADIWLLFIPGEFACKPVEKPNGRLTESK